MSDAGGAPSFGYLPQQTYVASPEQTYSALKSLLSNSQAYRLAFADDVTKQATFSSVQTGAEFTAYIFPSPAGGCVVQVAPGSTSQQQVWPLLTQFFTDLSDQLAYAGRTHKHSAPIARKGNPVIVIGSIALSGLLTVLSLLFMLNAWSIRIFIAPAIVTVAVVSISWYDTRKVGSQSAARIGTYVATALTALALIIGGTQAWQYLQNQELVSPTGSAAPTPSEAVPSQSDPSDSNPTESGSSESESGNCAHFDWPDSELASRLPVPDSDRGRIVTDSSDALLISVCDISSEQFNSYVQAVKDKGFTVDYYGSDGYFSAYDADGYSVSMNLTETMTITASAP